MSSVAVPQPNAGSELPNGAVLDRDALRARLSRWLTHGDASPLPHAVDRVPVQVERDVVCTNHQPVARAVDHVVIDLGGLGDYFTAAHLSR